MRHALALVALAAAAARPAGAGDAAGTPVLPPEIPWEGKSLSLVAGADDPWITPAERSGLRQTPRYDETIEWLQRLAASSPQLSMVALGESPEGRTVWMAVAAADGAATPEAARAAGRPAVLAHAGIHAGEIDGKDAGLMLLRDLVQGRHGDLLRRVTFLFIPVLNVDGHERFSRHGRVNQRGPEEVGWRTTARNLNLNRDFTKLDAPETRALIAAINAWQPDLYLDLHVTDGIDFQYDLTWGYNGPHAHSPAIGGWLAQRFDPAVERSLRQWGHVPGPLFFPVDAGDLSKGIQAWTGSPRFSNGYGDARHLPTVLLEGHSLKPYPQRVLGTYVFLETALRTVAAHAGELREAVRQDRSRRPQEVPLDWRFPSTPPPTFDLLAVESRRVPSRVSGADRVEWTGVPVTLQVPFAVMSEPAKTVARARAYWIPPAWDDVTRRLELHGIQVERTAAAREIAAEVYAIEGGGMEPAPFEGHARATGTAAARAGRVTFPAGSARVATDQPLGDLAALLLEPDSPDSFFRWGFFLEILQQTEYIEGYVIDPMGERMMAEDPALAAAFDQRLQEDAAFAGDPEARRRWFYERTPFADDRWRLYPVAREP